MAQKMTINQFLNDFGVKNGHLQEFGISFYQIAKYGNTPLDELPVDVNLSFTAVLTRFGYFCECGHE